MSLIETAARAQRATDATSRQTECATSIAHQMGIVDRLEAIVETLTDRLTPVLNPSPIASKGSTGERPPYHAPLADQIDRSTSRVSLANDRLQHLLDSLEV